MNIDDVMARLELLTGLSADQAEKFRPLGADAMAEISRRALQNDEASRGALTAAAAALAFYRWSLAGGATGIGTFSMGDVKITKGPKGIAAAREVWREAAAAAAPFLEDGEFVFRRA